MTLPIRGLENRVALVTGANHGIGAACAKKLAAEGAAVLLAYQRLEGPRERAVPKRYFDDRRQDASGVVGAIRAAGGRADAIEIDLAGPGVHQLLFDRAEASFGPVEILINNASGWLPDTFSSERTDRLGRQLIQVGAASYAHNFIVDTLAAAQLIAELARRHISRGASWGRIIGLTSGARGGFPGEVSYGAAKAAQENYTMSAAVELAPYGITANVVHPPITDTGWVTAEVVADLTASSGHHRVVASDEVAEVIAYLASEQAALVSGNVLRLR